MDELTGSSATAGGSETNIPSLSAPPDGVLLTSPSRGLISGSLWTLGGYAAAQALRFGSNLILARLLFPEAFGITALVWVVLDGLHMVSDLGLGPFIIQDPRGDEPSLLNTTWTLQVVRGFGVGVCALLLARPVAAFYGQPALASLLPLAGLVAVLKGLQSTSLYTLNRRLHLSKIVLLELLTQAVAAVVMVVIAWRCAAAWVLVVGALAGVLVRTCVSHRLLPGTRNRLHLHRGAGRALFRFGRWILLSTPLVFLAGQADRILLGRLVPLDVLGVYSIAARLAQLAGEAGLQVSELALYPAMAQGARANPEALGSEVRKARSIVLPVGVLSTLALVLLAPPFFHLLYDQRYQAAVWMAQLLGASVWVNILQGSADRALLAVGDSRALVVTNGAKFLATVGACALGFALFGVPGFIVGLACGALAGYAVVQLMLARHEVNTVQQDIGHTGMLLLAGLVAAAGHRAWPGPGGQAAWPSLAISGAVLLAVGAWAVLRIRSLGLGA
jgi:O-antigen/teichoic acid export membrane protein